LKHVGAKNTKTKVHIVISCAFNNKKLVHFVGIIIVDIPGLYIKILFRDLLLNMTVFVKTAIDISYSKSYRMAGAFLCFPISIQTTVEAGLCHDS
jgi:hypothetical protein